MMYLKFNDDRYFIPDDLYPRWMYWQEKINTATVKNYDELLKGSTNALKCEFKKYKVVLEKGALWRKYNGEVYNNRLSFPINTKIKIVKLNGEFVCYRVCKKIWKFNIGVGDTYCLNVWSFLRIFEKCND